MLYETTYTIDSKTTKLYGCIHHLPIPIIPRKHPPSCFRADALPETQQTFAILSLQFCATLQYIAHLLQQTWLWWIMVSHGSNGSKQGNTRP